ncbi:MAG: EamA family transporter [Myxococcota bacterium]
MAVALMSAFGWAGFDAARKALSGRMGTLALAIAIMALQLPLYGVWWALGGFEPVGLGYWQPGLLSLTGNIFANVLFLRSVRSGELGAVIPLLSLTPVFTLALGAAFLGEVPSVEQVVGVAAVVAGALVLQVPGTMNFTDFVTENMSNRAAGQMLMVAALWSATGTLDKSALAHAPAAFHALFVAGGIAATLTVTLAASHRLGELSAARENARGLAVAVVLSVVAMGLQLVAYGLMFVAVVEAIKRSVGMLGALVMGRIAFGEKMTARKLIVVAVMTAGVVLVLNGPR